LYFISIYLLEEGSTKVFPLSKCSLYTELLISLFPEKSSLDTSSAEVLLSWLFNGYYFTGGVASIKVCPSFL
ncbi:MAG: hypothetical protein PUJ51_12070, partial [Clostridiales bacterium]|uniref:hypothetical protein n=1 Tax=Terrisporobacter sp. TaxID=1965305 RepID=UPI002A53D3EF